MIIATASGNHKNVTAHMTRTLGNAPAYRVEVTYDREPHLNFVEPRDTKAAVLRCFDCWKHITH